jgi:hypothetical protein
MPLEATSMNETLVHPPKFVYDKTGQLVEVILPYEDYRTFLKMLAENVDWETLPPELQDAVDLMLIEEAKAEGGEPKSLERYIAERKSQ